MPDSSPELLDLEQVNEIIEFISRDFLVELVHTFGEIFPEQLDILERELNSGDFQQVRKTAHKIRSSAGSIGAASLATWAANLEYSDDAACQALADTGIGEFRRLFSDSMTAFEAIFNKPPPA